MSTTRAIRIEGGLFSSDTLEALARGEGPGQRPQDFGLDAARSLSDDLAERFRDALHLWTAFRNRLARLPETDSAAAVTRDAWVIPFLSLLDYQLVPNPRHSAADRVPFPVSHRAGDADDAPPIHIVGARQELGRVAVMPGLPRMSPHALLQEHLNVSDALWGIVTNGVIVRLLRTSTYLRRQAYVEFDLKTILEEQRFADFALLFRLIHRSRLPTSSADAHACLLEQYYQRAIEQGGRVRERLRDGVEVALRTLANGFLAHPANHRLRAMIAGSATETGMDAQAAELYRQTLRLVYRFLFLLVAEERGLMDDTGHPGADAGRTDGGAGRTDGGAGRAGGGGDGATHHRGDGAMPPRGDGAMPPRGDGAMHHRGDGAMHHRGDGAMPPRGDGAMHHRGDGAMHHRGDGAMPPRGDGAMPPRGDGAMHRLYRDHYGVGRLGRLAMDRRAYDDHDDLWHGLRALWRTLADETLAAILGAPPLNGDLFAPLTLDDCSIANRDLLAAIRHLTYYRERDDAPLRRVNYAALDVEELGSVYESLLDYHPVIEADGARLRFDLIGGSERKSTGSYYTPPELVQELVRSALAPVIAERLEGAAGAAVRPGAPSFERTRAAREQALLSIRVLDPACGSGHFLLAAARLLGKELARIRTGEDEPAPERVREAIREVTTHCIYGVDKNPLAVDLCKVALWLEAHNPGKPLTFLDHRIRCGDSLVGVVDLDLVRQGVPDAAFEPKEGDDRALARSAKKRNAAERGGQLTLRFEEAVDLSDLRRAAREMDDISDDTPQQVRKKRQRFDALRQAQQPLRLACDLWTAAFFQRLAPGEMIIASAAVADALEGRPVHGQAAGVATALAAQHRFFHWALEFPEAVTAGGFDVILGNPPWERIKLQEQEFFASRDAQVANAPNAAARRRMIDRLQQTNPALWQEFADALRAAAAASQFLRGSGRFPLTGTGDINTYAVFAELAMQLLAPRGRAGIITPTGIATDATTQRFFRTLTGSGRLVSLYDFENRQKLFPAVDSRMKFCLLTMRGAAPSAARGTDGGAAEFAFFCHSADDLRDEERRFTLTPEDFRLLNPNTGTAPIFRSRRDAELTKAIYRRVPPLVRDDGGAAGNPWGVEFMTMFHMANDSHLFRGGEGNERLLPLYEAKLIHQFDHRWATYDGDAPRDLTAAEKADPSCVVTPRYWVPAAEVEARLAAKGWTRPWLLGWRDITNATNERTVIAAVIPRVGVGHTLPLFLPRSESPIDALLALLNSLALDFVARQKIGGTHLTFNYLEQLPVLPPGIFAQPCPWAPEGSVGEFVRPRVLELTYTAWDLAPFARELGYDGPPFRFDPERRFALRCELDAAFFHLYLPAEADGSWKRATAEWAVVAETDDDLARLTALFPTPRDAVAYILDQFPIVRRKDEAQFGVYRTKETILAIYDAMPDAQRRGAGARG